MLDRSDDISTTVENWLAQFETALNASDDGLLTSLFHPDSYWRDTLALSWTLQTVNGRDEILRVLKAQAGGRSKPSLLVAPASLLANWAAEIARFAPSLTAIVVHPSAMPIEQLKTDGGVDLASVDLAITSYGFLTRAPWLVQRTSQVCPRSQSLI